MIASQYLIKCMTVKTWDVINIPIIPNMQVVQYSVPDVTTLPTSFGLFLTGEIKYDFYFR